MSTTSTIGNPVANDTTWTKFQAIDKAVTDYMKTYNVPGISICMQRRANNRNQRYRQGYGLANTDPNNLKGVQVDSQFRIASVSKPITALAFVILESQKKVSFNAPVFGPNGYLKNFTPRPGKSLATNLEKITPKHLLQHTAGWDRATAKNPWVNSTGWDPMFDPSWIAKTLNDLTPNSASSPASADDIVTFMLSEPLQSVPGETMAYSNFGYCVLGRIIEAVTGENYCTWVMNNVLKPLEVSSLTEQALTRYQDAKPGEVHYYPDNKTHQSMFPNSPLAGEPYGPFVIESMDAHGGWLSTAEDLVIMASKITPSQFHLFTDVPEYIKDTRKPTDSYYGNGWSVELPSAGHARIMHDGGLNGTRAFLIHDPTEEWTISILMNYNLTSNTLPMNPIFIPLYNGLGALGQ